MAGCNESHNLKLELYTPVTSADTFALTKPLSERKHSRYLLPVQANPSESVTAASLQHEPQYAEVALPVHVGQAFTYRLTESMQDFAQPGARILVPFGRKLIVGYIVGLQKELKEN